MCAYIKLSPGALLKNHIVLPKYIEFLFLNYTLIKLGKKRKFRGLHVNSTGFFLNDTCARIG